MTAPADTTAGAESPAAFAAEPPPEYTIHHKPTIGGIDRTASANSSAKSCTVSGELGAEAGDGATGTARLSGIVIS
jgi:hypothetical protein